MKTTVAEIGMRYNSTLARQEAGRALELARQRAALLDEQGVTLRQLEELAAHSERLYPLDLAQVKTQQDLQRMTDLVTRLLSRSIGTISRVYILADVALGRSNPEALQSLPSRSGTITVARNSASLLTCAQFVGAHKEAFLASGASATLEEELTAASRELSEADKAQEKCKVLAQEASNTLFHCRGEIYLGCKRIYLAGRNLYRKEPQVQAMFAFEYMTKNSSKSENGQQPTEKAARRAERKALRNAVALAKQHASVHAKASAAMLKADKAQARAERAQARAAAAQARIESLTRSAGAAEAAKPEYSQPGTSVHQATLATPFSPGKEG